MIRLWGSDVTYARVNDAFCAICVIIDLFSLRAIAHTISANNDTTLVLTTFKIAYAEKRRTARIIVSQ